MTAATVRAKRRASRSFRRNAAALAALAASVGPLVAAEPIPLAAGLYCGPGDARIVIDVARDQVTIDNMVCSFPVIAADHLQSDLCSTPEGKSIEESFDFRVVGRDFIHDAAWYHPCGPVPANPVDPGAAVQPKASD